MDEQDFYLFIFNLFFWNGQTFCFNFFPSTSILSLKGEPFFSFCFSNLFFFGTRGQFFEIFNLSIIKWIWFYFIWPHFSMEIDEQFFFPWTSISSWKGEHWVMFSNFLSSRMGGLFFPDLQPFTFGVGRQCLISHFNHYLFWNW